MTELRSQWSSGETLLSEQVIIGHKYALEGDRELQSFSPSPACYPMADPGAHCALFSLSLKPLRTKLTPFPWFPFAHLSSGFCFRERTGAEGNARA